jgi:hypothetical protein
LRIGNLYNCGCEDCKDKASQLNLSLNDTFKNLLKTAEKAFKRLHEKGSYSPKDLQTDKEYQNLIKETNAIFNKTVVDNVIEGEMLESLQNDIYLFSGLKTHAQLFEASRLLLDEKGQMKPFSTFSKDFQKINKDYNQTYLNAEYDYAVGTAQGIARWETFSDDDKTYNLQYRIDGGPNVRESHRALDRITLPKSDPFWGHYNPKNGWNCHCMTVQVLADKYPKSDSAKAIEAGEKATTQIGKDGKNRLEIFRFNPAKEKVIFPPTHPYTKVAGAKVVENNSEKEFFKNLRHTTKERLVDGHVTVERSELKSPICFTSKGIKEAFNQPHYNKKAKNMMVSNMDKVLKRASYLGNKEDYKHNQMVSKIHVFETVIDNQKTYLINRELITGEIHFYSVSDGENLLIGIKK